MADDFFKRIDEDRQRRQAEWEDDFQRRQKQRAAEDEEWRLQMKRFDKSRAQWDDEISVSHAQADALKKRMVKELEIQRKRYIHEMAAFKERQAQAEAEWSARKSRLGIPVSIHGGEGGQSAYKTDTQEPPSPKGSTPAKK